METGLINSLNTIRSKPWNKHGRPRRILAIRLQAMGDLVICLPYLKQLKENLTEDVVLDLLTREEAEAIPRNIPLFNKVYSLGGGRNEKKQFIYTLLLYPGLLFRRYDVVIDLQHNRISRMIRKMLFPSAWSEFDKYSPIAAGESTRLTIEAAGLGSCHAVFRSFSLEKEESIDAMLKYNGWDGASDLVVLNPAGAFITRNWPLENYVQFARIWLTRFPGTQFLVIGLSLVEQKARFLQEHLGDKMINLVNKTNPYQAFAIVQQIKFILTEDSGLMHMAWVSGVPTLALFGSTNSVRATPLGPHSFLFNSSDLACGNCMQETCKYGDTRCLARFSPIVVFEKAMMLI